MECGPPARELVLCIGYEFLISKEAFDPTFRRRLRSCQQEA
jgi:hypothetical protein